MLYVPRIELPSSRPSVLSNVILKDDPGMLHLKIRRIRSIAFRSTLLIAFVASLIFTGCESTLDVPEKPADNATVSGTVTLNGKPVSGGNVGFYSMQFGMAGQAALDKEGKFTLSEPIAPGDYQIYFMTDNGQPLRGIPAKYMSETSSDYSVTVKESNNQLAIDLKS
ncbi:hypothetical protein [Gimesia aquarii]|uniref:Carboxypeptidase regulatory-like domain-containing protein n=1 Tax=Gimesia aquarii TaxID=2527964 RepID=A0A517WPF1_9PLAN|nr:hypothetical protein [Gimesia aquarii]QDU07120.1 hypothetical protein V202x_04700 [Gimesia aquarii]